MSCDCNCYDRGYEDGKDGALEGPYIDDLIEKEVDAELALRAEALERDAADQACFDFAAQYRAGKRPVECLARQLLSKYDDVVWDALRAALEEEHSWVNQVVNSSMGLPHQVIFSQTPETD